MVERRGESRGARRFRVPRWNCRLALLGLTATAMLHAENPPAPAASPPALQLAISDYSAAAGARLTLAGAPDHQVRLEANAEATGPAGWIAIATNRLDVSGAWTHVDAAAAGLSARFYRAVDLDAGAAFGSNVVGFVKVDVPVGRALIACPFLSADNRISALLPHMPNGVSLYKVAPGGAPVVNNFVFGWSDAAMTLLPGEGALLENPFGPATTITFKGEVIQGPTTNHVPAGDSLGSSIRPHPGDLETILEFPPADGDTVNLWTGGAPYLEHFYDDGFGWDPAPPVLRAAEAFWVAKSSAAAWTQNLVITAPGGSAYVVTNHALTSAVPRINFMTYSVDPDVGRVFDGDGVTPLAAGYRGQLYAGTATNDEAAFQAVGEPAPFLSGPGAGYIRSGLVAIPGLAGGQQVYLQLRVWDAVHATYEAATASGAKSGRSAVISANAPVDLFPDPPRPANAFPSFRLPCSRNVAVRLDGQAIAGDAATNAGPVQVELMALPPGGTVFYSLDGSDPRRGSWYVGPFAVARSAVIRAVVFPADFSQEEESCPFALTILEPPAIVEGPQDLLVAAGATAEFQVTAAGSPPLSFQWRFEGAALAGATAPTLSLANVHFTNAGAYSAVVSNAVGAVTSAVARLMVRMPPSVTIDPAGTNIARGASVTFRADATGTAPLIYQWRKNAVNVPGATNAEYTIANVEIPDGGSYSVVVANEVGAVTSDPALLVVQAPGDAAPPGDHFAQRVALGTNLFAAGTNRFATREAGEPRHAGKFGSNSVWYTWRPPANGQATLRTAGSTFDTLLAVYTGTNVAQLQEVASDEDRAGFHNSELRFNASGDVDYHIAVDGYAGQRGAFTLALEFTATAVVLPVITNPPLSQVVTPGATVTFTVGASGSGLGYQWFSNGVLLSGATGPALSLTNVQRAAVGHYTVLVTNASGGSVLSLPAVLELGTAASPIVARDKLEDLRFGVEPGMPSGGRRPESGIGGNLLQVSAGDIAARTFSNTGGTSSPDEPNHCQRLLNATMWLYLRANANGTLAVDTFGSTMPTLLAAYEEDGGLILPALACAVTNAPDGFSCRVRFTARAGATYALVVDGVDRRVGDIQLNWALGQPPAAIPGGVTNLFLKPGERLALDAGVTPGLPAPAYQWSLDRRELPGATGPTLAVANLQPGDAGLYSVRVGNPIGQVTRDVARVQLDTTLLSVARSTFDLGGENWGFSNDVSELVFEAAGGNPGGCLRAADQQTGNTWFWLAPAAFRGDRSTAYGGWLQFDLRQSVVGDAYLGPADVILIGGGRELHFDTARDPGTNWTFYNVPLRENMGWRRGSLDGPVPTCSEMVQTLADLTAVLIRGEFSTARDVGWLDNVALVGPVPGAAAGPPLRISRPTGDQLLLEWPAAPPGFQLESLPRLGNHECFEAIPVAGMITDGVTNRLIVPAGGEQRFFRLRRP